LLINVDVSASTAAYAQKRVSVNATSAHLPHQRPLFVDCHSCWLGIER